MPKGDLLIAEDDPILRQLYQRKFSLEGYQIRTANDGEEAVKLLTEQLPSLLVLDINMPKMDGFQVLELLPKEKRTFPVIMLSNLADDRTLARSKELGADGFLVKKDMTIKGLLELVEKLITLRKPQ
ncbi:MAG: response regulator [Candidatus Peribacteraceae bacterium]|nr:response regulator [Candidatus Peribacteraceae bacterium]